jgi:hypothetical protein
MALLVGVLLAITVGVMTTIVGFARDRSFYPTVMIVIAAIYTLFAAMGATTQTLVFEALAGLIFIAVAVWGFKSSLWLVAAALAAHGIFDVGHDYVISNPGVPVWWPAFCSAYDLTAAGFLALLITSGRVRAAT